LFLPQPSLSALFGYIATAIAISLNP